MLVGFDGVQLLDLAGPADVFDVATRLLQARDGKPAYRIVVASPDGGPVRTSSGVRLAADARLAALDPRKVDTIIVGGALSVDGVLRDARLIDALPSLADGARRTCSVCGGAVLLAEAGLLAGRNATTHWALCRELANRYPSVRIEPDRIFVRDGNIVTSAGVTAGIDLALGILEEDHGAELARRVARWMVVFLQRPGGQSQFSEWLEAPIPADSPIRELVGDIVADPAGDHRVPTLAERAALSERQLARVFLREAGTTPGRFVQRVRVEAARNLLEASALSAETISVRCGFGSPETMRRAFLRVLAVSPGEYRARFRQANAATERRTSTPDPRHEATNTAVA